MEQPTGNQPQLSVPPTPPSSQQQTSRPRRAEDRHIWEFAWVRDLLWITGFSLLFALMLAARSILVPVAVALALAYVFNPLITYLDRRWRLPRWAGTSVLFAALFLLVSSIALATVPPLIAQTDQLIRKTPGYAREAAEVIDVDLSKWTDRVRSLINRITGQAEKEEKEGAPSPPQSPPATTPDTETEVSPPPDGPELRPPPIPPPKAEEQAQIPWESVGQVLLRGLGMGYDLVSGILSFVTYLILFLFITAFCFFFFSCHFQGVIDWFKQFVPLNHMEQTSLIVGKMDKTLSAFIRGRLVQSLALGMVLSIGWWIAGVPYWLLLGMGCGFLNLIPYAAFVGWPLAILLTWADQLGGTGTAAQTFDFWAILVWPSVVYFIGQSLDGWVVEPLVQGRATALDPASVLLAVLIGATLAGVLGMILAIPVAACSKILAQEVILPKLRNRAQIVKP